MRLNIGDKIKLDIRKQGINGEGIGYYNRVAVFVPGAILKESIFCEITYSQENYAVGKIISFERVSKRRVEPPCKYYEACGGCQMQHIDYKEQLKIKQKTIVQALRKYTSLENDEYQVKKTLGMDEPYYYRNRSQMPFKNTNFGLALGFYKPESNNFVYIDECIVHTHKLNDLNKAILKSLRRYKLKANDQHNKEGILVYLVTRYLEKTNSASVTFVVTKYKDTLEMVAKDLMSDHEEIKSVSYTLKNRNSHLVIANPVKIIAGEDHIEDVFEDMTVKISPDAFHQLNSKQMEVLYNQLMKAADLDKETTVFDLYSGIGITSMLFAKKAKKVYGIDYSQASVKDARENAKLNNIKNIDFIEGHVEGEVPNLVKKRVKPDVVVLDPPRKGMATPVVETLLDVLPKQIVYVSCNPSTLAKNIADLSEKYKIAYIQPIDMFPNTASVESITVLNLR